MKTLLLIAISLLTACALPNRCMLESSYFAAKSAHKLQHEGVWAETVRLDFANAMIPGHCVSVFEMPSGELYVYDYQRGCAPLKTADKSEAAIKAALDRYFDGIAQITIIK